MIAVRNVQSIVIEMNKTGLVNDSDTRTVIDSVAVSLVIVRESKMGWQPAVVKSLENLQDKLKEPTKSKVEPYIEVAKIVIRRFK